MSEQTVFMAAELPADGPDFVWHSDLNLVELRCGMTLDEKLAAVEELKRTWTREHLSVVRSA